MTMDAVLTTIVASGQAPVQLNIEVDKHMLISTLIYWIYLNPLTAALYNVCTRPPATRTAQIHQIHTAGGASSSITMVVVFVGCLCCCGLTCDVTSSLYVKQWYKNNPKEGLGGEHFVPHWRAPYHIHHTHIGCSCTEFPKFKCPMYVMKHKQNIP